MSRRKVPYGLMFDQNSAVSDLAIAIGDHPQWATVPAETRVSARMDLKKRTRPADEPADEPAAAEAA